MRELSLFSGAGGGLLGSCLLGWTPVGYVEKNEHCQKIIAQRIKDGILPVAPIFGDIRVFARRWAGGYQGVVDILTAGFPCQPFSQAGARQAARGHRNLWPWTIRVIRKIGPQWCLLENVPGLLARSHGYYGEVLRDLAEAGYDAVWGLFSAAECGAPHIRYRLWVLAYPNRKWRRQRLEAEQAGFEPIGHVCQMAHADGIRKYKRKKFITKSRNRISYRRQNMAFAKSDSQRPGLWKKRKKEKRRRRFVIRGEHVANSGCKRLSVSKCKTVFAARRRFKGRTTSQQNWWAIEPAMGRMAHGVANRVDRLKALGNGQVPLVVVKAWEALTEVYNALHC